MEQLPDWASASWGLCLGRTGPPLPWGRCRPPLQLQGWPTAQPPPVIAASRQGGGPPPCPAPPLYLLEEVVEPGPEDVDIGIGGAMLHLLGDE